MFGIFELFFNIIGIFISISSGIPYIDLSTGESYFAMFFIITPAVLSFVFYKIKIKGVDLYLYIIFVFKYSFSPKYKDVDGNTSDNKRALISLYIDE